MKYTKLFTFLILTVLFSACEKEELPIVEPEVEVIEEDLSGNAIIEIDGEFVLAFLERRPQYILGGDKGMYEQTVKIIRYPAAARNDGIQGRVMVQYEVTVEGKTENITILENPGGGLGEEVVRTLEIITEGVSFYPGIYQSNYVRSRHKFPILFKL